MTWRKRFVCQCGHNFEIAAPLPGAKLIELIYPCPCGREHKIMGERGQEIVDGAKVLAGQASLFGSNPLDIKQGKLF